MESTHPTPSIISEPPQSNEPARKRPRLSAGAHASIITRCADPATSLEVDHMILDYLAWRAIESCLSEGRPYQKLQDPPSQEPGLSLVNKFLRLFQSRYPTFEFDPELRFRMLLLKFLALFTQRHTHNSYTPTRDSIVKSRARNQERAKQWIENIERIPTGEHDTAAFDESLPIPKEELRANRTQVLTTLGLLPDNETDDRVFYGSSDCISLLDLLPLFVQLSAACNAMFGGGISLHWMHLATELMLQACLEQYLVFGASGCDSIDEAFAWGYKPNITDQANTQATKMDHQINSMFEDIHYATEVGGWSKLRDAVLEQLFLEGSARNSQESYSDMLVEHLYALASEMPMKNTERKTRAYIISLSQCIPEPLLVQLEKGKLDGMSEGETTQFVKDCGLDLKKLFK